MIENTCPILRVEDLARSLDYYEGCLGFRCDWKDDSMAGISRDGRGIMLCLRAQGHPGTWVWIGVHDAQKLYEEYCESGAQIRHAPLNHPWALEFKVEDLDGHVLRFGSGPLEGRPFDEFSG